MHFAFTHILARPQCTITLLSRLTDNKSQPTYSYLLPYSVAEAQQAGPTPAPGLFKMLSYRFAGAGAGSAPVVASGVGQSIPEDAEVTLPSHTGGANAQGTGLAVNPMVTSPGAPSAGAAAAAAILANAAAAAASTTSSPPKKQPSAAAASASASAPSSSGFDWTYGKEQFELIKVPPSVSPNNTYYLPQPPYSHNHTSTTPLRPFANNLHPLYSLGACALLY